MAAVPVEIRGTLYDLQSKSSREVFLDGQASIKGLGVGGGPIIPPEGGGGGQPPGIWGPTDPRPTPPIPIYPGGTPNPPGIWGPTDPRPTPPIHLGPGGDIGGPPSVGGGPIIPPDEGTKPPEPIQPPVDWKAVWHPTEGWIVVGIPSGEHPTPSET